MNAHKFLPIAGAMLTLALAEGPAAAQEIEHRYEPIHETGVSAGVAVGDVTSFDLKIWFLPHSGIDMGIGVNEFSDRLALYGELELALMEWGMGPDTRGIFYLGPGVQGVFDDPSEELSLLVPVGIDFQFRNPLNLFLELRPGIMVSPDTEFVIGGQAGLRAIF